MEKIVNEKSPQHYGYSRLTIDRNRFRPDIITKDFASTEICLWPLFLLLKVTDDEMHLYKLSKFVIFACDPFNVQKLRNGNILI